MRYTTTDEIYAMSNPSPADPQQKIKRVARRLRLAVWLACAGLLGLLLSSWLTGQPLIGVHGPELGEEVTAALVAKAMYPETLNKIMEGLQLFGVGLFLFWLQRLLGFFQRGDYFSNAIIHCYLWMAWVFFILLLLPGLHKLYLHYLAYRYLPEVDVPVDIVVNFSSVVLLVLLPLIIYLLRIAQAQELENKEFI